MLDEVWNAAAEQAGPHYVAEGFNSMLSYTLHYFRNVITTEELLVWQEVSSLLLGVDDKDGGRLPQAFVLLVRLITRKPTLFSVRRLQTDYEEGSENEAISHYIDVASAVALLQKRSLVLVFEGGDVGNLLRDSSRSDSMLNPAVATASMLKDLCLALSEEASSPVGKKRWRTKEASLEGRGRFSTKQQCVEYIKGLFEAGAVDNHAFSRLWNLIVGDVVQVREDVEANLRRLFEYFDIACRFDPRRALDTAVASRVDSTTVHSGGHSFGAVPSVARRGVSLTIALAHAGCLPTPGLGGLPICIPRGEGEAFSVLRRGRPFDLVDPPTLLLFSSREGLTNYSEALETLRSLVDAVDLGAELPRSEEVGRFKAVLLLHQAVENGLQRALELQRLFQLWRAVRTHLSLPSGGETLEDVLLGKGPLSPSCEGLLSLLPAHMWLRCAEYLLEVLSRNGDDDDATATNKAMSTLWLRRLLVEAPILEVVNFAPCVVAEMAGAFTDSQEGGKPDGAIPSFLLECLRSGRHAIGAQVRSLCRSRATGSLSDCDSDPSVHCQLAKDTNPPNPHVQSVLSVPYRYQKRGHWWHRLAVCAYSGIRTSDSEMARLRKSRAQSRALTMLESLFFNMVQWRGREEAAVSDKAIEEGVAPYATATEVKELHEGGLFTSIVLTPEESSQLSVMRLAMPEANCLHNLLWSTRQRWFMRRADIINCERVLITLHTPPRRWKDPPRTLLSYNLLKATEVFVRARRGADGGWLRGAEASYVLDEDEGRQSLNGGVRVEEVSAQWYRAGSGRRPQVPPTSSNYQGVPWDANHVEGWWYEQLVRSLFGPIFTAPNGAFI